jgi:hypothetical protein
MKWPFGSGLQLFVTSQEASTPLTIAHFFRLRLSFCDTNTTKLRDEVCFAVGKASCGLTGI